MRFVVSGAVLGRRHTGIREFMRVKVILQWAGAEVAAQQINRAINRSFQARPDLTLVRPPAYGHDAKPDEQERVCDCLLAVDAAIVPVRGCILPALARLKRSQTARGARELIRASCWLSLALFCLTSEVRVAAC